MLAGSFVSDNIEDYYTNPYDLGYGQIVKFDHDFIGREALEGLDARGAAQEGHAGVERRGRRRDLRVAARRRGPGLQFFDLPNANYGSSNFDSVIDADGNVVGYLDVHRLQRQRAPRAVAGDDRPGDPGSAPSCASSGASRTAAPQKTTVERHIQKECARSSARCPTRSPRDRSTPRGGGRGAADRRAVASATGGRSRH